MTDTEYMMLALEEARKAEAEGEIPIGALVVYRDLIIAAAHNEKKEPMTPPPMQKSQSSVKPPDFWAHGV